MIARQLAAFKQTMATMYALIRHLPPTTPGGKPAYVQHKPQIPPHTHTNRRSPPPHTHKPQIPPHTHTQREREREGEDTAQDGEGAKHDGRADPHEDGQRSEEGVKLLLTQLRADVVNKGIDLAQPKHTKRLQQRNMELMHSYHHALIPPSTHTAMCSLDCTGWKPTNDICIDSMVPRQYTCREWNGKQTNSHQTLPVHPPPPLPPSSSLCSKQHRYDGRIFQ